LESTLSSEEKFVGDGSALANKLQQLKSEDYTALLQSAYDKILASLQRVSFIRELVQSVVSSAREEGKKTAVNGEPSRRGLSLPAVYCDQVIDDTSELLYSVCELAHTKCARLLKLRADANARMGIPDFVQFFEVTQTFINNSEKLCGKQCYGLRPVPLSQVKWLC
jgi:hypothetical protein